MVQRLSGTYLIRTKKLNCKHLSQETVKNELENNRTKRA